MYVSRERKLPKLRVRPCDDEDIDVFDNDWLEAVYPSGVLHFIVFRYLIKKAVFISNIVNYYNV